MTKAEIIDAVYEQVGGFSKKEAADVVEAVFDTMKEVLGKGEKIKISGFGNFVVRAKKQRVGRNPQTGAPIPIEARRVATFKPSHVLKTRLNPHMAGDGAAAKAEVAKPAAVKPATNHMSPPGPRVPGVASATPAIDAAPPSKDDISSTGR